MTLKSTIIPKKVRVFYATYANLPTTGLVEEDLGYATDRLVLYRWDGAAWQPITIHVSSGAAASIPTAANLPNGSIYHETDTDLVKMVEAGAWVIMAAVITNTLSTVISANLRNSNDAEKLATSQAYTKIKEVLLNADLPACTIKFDLKSSIGARNAYGRIYKNGVAIGTEQIETTTTYATYSEDFTGFVATDLIQIYGKHVDVGESAYIRNMQFFYDLTITALHGSILTTPLASTSDPTISMTNQDP